MKRAVTSNSKIYPLRSAIGPAIRAGALELHVVRHLRFSSVTKVGFHLRRQWLSIIFIAILGALVLNCVYGPMGPRDLLVLRHHRIQLTAVRDRMFAEHAQLKQRITKLKSDDAYLQRLIRQELGYAREDDFVYRFPDDKRDLGR